MSEFFQDVSPDAVPSPVTPQAGPGDPAGWAQVTPHGNMTAPYDIAAPQDLAGITAAVDAAGALTGAGIVYAQGPRQHEAEALLDSPQGTPAMNITSGFPDYENTDISPGADTENPIQGEGGGYPGTDQGGVQQYGGDDGGIEGLSPETGGLGDGSGNYPGTDQPGMPTYGT